MKIFMLKLLPLKLTILITMLLCSNLSFGQIISDADGDWNDGSTWEGGDVPDKDSDVDIGHEVTIKATAESKDLNIVSGFADGLLQINSNVTLDVYGNFANDNSFDAKDNSTIVFKGSDNKTVKSDGDSFYDTEISKDIDYRGVKAEDDIIIRNNLIITKGKIETSSKTISIVKDFENNSNKETREDQGDEGKFQFTGAKNSEIKGSTTTEFYDLTLAKDASSYSLAFQQNAVVEGDLSVSTGEMDLNGKTVTIHGDFTNNDNFTANGGVVEFTGSDNSQISGSTTFQDVAISKSSNTVTVNDNITVDGNLTINDGTLDLNGKIITVKGDLTNDGTITANGGNIVFEGSSTSSISGSSINFSDLEVNKSGGDVSLSDSITINSSLTLTSGNITTNGNSLVFEDNASVSGNLGTNYIVGKVTKTGDDNFTFPTGASGIYGAATIDNTGGATTDQFSVTYHRDTPPNFSNFDASNHTDLETISQLEYWEVTRDNGSSDPNLELHWADGDDSQINNEGNIHIVHDNGSDWDDLGAASTTGSGGSGNSGSVQVNSVSSFSTFTFGSTSSDDDPLPIDLIAFDANCNGQDQAIVNWSTATEINNDYFEIQVSDNGKNYTAKKTVAGAGNSNVRKDYKSTIELEGKENYIRLKQVDYDGKSETFDPVYVHCTTQEQNVEIYPNPVVQNLKIHLGQQPEENVQVSVYTTHGKKVFTKRYEANSTDIKVSGLDHLSEGIYFLEVIMKDQRIIRKFSK